MKRQLISQLKAILKDPSLTEAELLFRLKKLIYKTDVKAKGTEKSVHSATAVKHHLKKRAPGLSKASGFSELDTTYGGLQSGELVLLAARPLMGKTQLMVNLALNLLKSHSILYYSGDLSRALLMKRFIASLSSISMRRLLSDALPAKEEKRVLAIEKKLLQMKLFFNTEPYFLEDFKALCKKQIKENNVKVIFVDAIEQLCHSKKKAQREEELSFISCELKKLAVELHISIVVALQLGSSVEKRVRSPRPILSDLKGFGTIKKYADKVLFLYRPDYYLISKLADKRSSEGRAELIVAKNKNGATGTLYLKRDPDFTNFTALTQKN
jgi:replicative DNA helicase